MNKILSVVCLWFVRALEVCVELNLSAGIDYHESLIQLAVLESDRAKYVTSFHPYYLNSVNFLNSFSLAYTFIACADMLCLKGSK